MYKVVLVIEHSRKFGRGLLEGIAQYSRLHGPWTFYRMPFYLGIRQTFDSQYTISAAELRYIKEWGATGIIMRQVKNINAVISLGLPTIVSRYASKKVSKAVETYGDDEQARRNKVVLLRSGNEKIGRMAAEHLLEKGLVNFAFCGYDKFFWSKDRCKGFCERIKEAGHSVIVYKPPKQEEMRLWHKEQIILAKWLKSLPKPIGLMASIDERSSDILETCRISDIRVPEQIALIGADNDDLICDLANPTLSSVALNAVRAGYQAAELLGELMSGKVKGTDRQIIIEPTHVEQRMSTDIIAVNDPVVADAIRFIRMRAHEPIGVEDVVEKSLISRRNLELKFKNALGCSILHEINRVRCAYIEKMLTTTNISVSELVSKMGFSSTNNIARFFRNEKGMSLLGYRRRYGQK